MLGKGGSCRRVWALVPVVSRRLGLSAGTSVRGLVVGRSGAGGEGIRRSSSLPARQS